MLKRLLTWWRQRHYFVLMDPRDNSVTYSRRLFAHIKKLYGQSDGQPKVFVFFVPDTKYYGFAVNVPLDQPTQVADIQYNSKHRCIGFETLNPTVARIFYDYNISDITKPCRLTVTAHRCVLGNVFFQIEIPRKS